MKFLIDTSKDTLLSKQAEFPDLVAGQLITPLTGYSNAKGLFAIDNGAFSKFLNLKFQSLLRRDADYKANCLFVVVPDIVGNARRTLELWQHRELFVGDGWPLALVAQDGIEDLTIPWDQFKAIFIGGRDPWKDSQAAADIVKTAKTLDKHVHVGRVNTLRRYTHYTGLGADTCDGSGIAKYDHMLVDIANGLKPSPTLFDNEMDNE
jgi:hypothetical protein